MTAVVTGASSGIGKATAIELYNRGVNVVVSGRSQERLGDVAEKTGNSRFVVGDISESAVCDSLFRDMPDGPIRAVFAAGNAEFGPTLEFTSDKWRAAIDANLTGLFNCCKSAIAAMLPRGGGKIVAVLSIASKHPFPESAAYVASKTGALGLIRSLQAEFRSQGIAITAFIPGSTDTELWDRQKWTPDPKDMIDPRDVANTIADIIMDESSGVYDEVVYMPKGGIL